MHCGFFNPLLVPALRAARPFTIARSSREEHLAPHSSGSSRRVWVLYTSCASAIALALISPCVFMICSSGGRGEIDGQIINRDSKIERVDGQRASDAGHINGCALTDVLHRTHSRTRTVSPCPCIRFLFSSIFCSIFTLQGRLYFFLWWTKGGQAAWRKMK